jgi:hypothetical protein
MVVKTDDDLKDPDEGKAKKQETDTIYELWFKGPTGEWFLSNAFKIKKTVETAYAKRTEAIYQKLHGKLDKPFKRIVEVRQTKKTIKEE